MRKPRVSICMLGIAALSALLSSPKANAIPAFSRTYNTSCSTCHIDFPKLNDFGKAFKDAGFRFPKDDESMIKIPPVMLGAPAQIELWPHAIWPGKIPGIPPIGLRMNNFFHVVSRNRGNLQFVPPEGATPPFVPAFTPRSDFETGLFSIFTAGNFGSDIAFWVDDDLSIAGSNGAGGLGDAYIKFVNLGRIFHLPKDALNLRAGQFELELPFSPARSWNISGWDIFDQTNVGVTSPAFPGQDINNSFAMSSATQGVELSGGHHYGGYFYAVSVSNQNTGGAISDTSHVPASPSDAFQSDSNFKNVYARLMYRRNLERNKESRNAIQAAGATGPRDHTYLSLGTFYLYGRSVQRFIGTSPTGTCAAGTDISGCVLLTAREPFYRTGFDFSFNYRAFNLFGTYIFGHDHNLVPIDSSGAGVPVGDPTAVGFVRGPASEFNGGFLEADYLPVPWTILIMRYDAINSRADFLNGLAGPVGTVRATRNRITPGVQFLIHANIKTSFEYQIRPRQQIVSGTDFLTGNRINIPPFRTNTATFGLEFVY